MVQMGPEHRLDAVEAALRQAAHRYKASIEGVAHMGRHLRESGAGEDALSFSISIPELYGALLEAEIRMSVFLPCRIVAYTRNGRVELETVSPVDFCRVLNRPDLAPLVMPLENLLRKIMREASTPLASAVATATATHREGLGATEDQMNTRGAIPQRIDAHGTKVEELGGTGELDSQGG
jgi:hypothetical protein